MLVIPILLDVLTDPSAATRQFEVKDFTKHAVELPSCN